ncbi:MAG: crotonase/enoyl-CoA hydratase family protein [Acidimicrobiales bacterium]
MVEYEVIGRVAVLTINRPEARNAVNGDVARQMEENLDRLEDDDDVWLGIVTGNGPVFCAGADLKAIAAGKAGDLQTKRGGFAGIATRERTKPLIAAVDGPALAGGTEIVLSCDLVVASTAATFGIPEVKRSLVAAAGGLFRLPRALPLNVAMEAALTGDPITAERAAHFGLVNELVEPGRAKEAALALAERISANAPIAVRESRRVVLAALRGDDENLWKITTEAMAKAMSSEDFNEGPRAFIEKRAPQWKGR